MNTAVTLRQEREQKSLKTNYYRGCNCTWTSCWMHWCSAGCHAVASASKRKQVCSDFFWMRNFFRDHNNLLGSLELSLCALVLEWVLLQCLKQNKKIPTLQQRPRDCLFQNRKSLTFLQKFLIMLSSSLRLLVIIEKLRDSQRRHTHTTQPKHTQNMNAELLEQIKDAAQWLQEADAVLIGAGAGLSAEADNDFTDTVAFARRFPAMAKRGYKMPYEFIGKTDWTPNLEWGYLSAFINLLRFNFPQHEVYQTLKQLGKLCTQHAQFSLHFFSWGQGSLCYHKQCGWFLSE